MRLAPPWACRKLWCIHSDMRTAHCQQQQELCSNLRHSCSAAGWRPLAGSHQDKHHQNSNCSWRKVYNASTRHNPESHHWGCPDLYSMLRRISVVITMIWALGLTETSPVIRPTSWNSSSSSLNFWLLKAWAKFWGSEAYSRHSIQNNMTTGQSPTCHLSRKWASCIWEEPMRNWHELGFLFAMAEDFASLSCSLVDAIEHKKILNIQGLYAVKVRWPSEVMCTQPSDCPLAPLQLHTCKSIVKKCAHVYRSSLAWHKKVSWQKISLQSTDSSTSAFTFRRGKTNLQSSVGVTERQDQGA